MKSLAKNNKGFFRAKSRRDSEGGFTIIEVLIVLAIAGLILLIVFLAVPALQRNSRNTQRKNDVSALLGAVNEFTSNHNGELPDSSDDEEAVLSNAGLGYYSGGLGAGEGQVEFNEDTASLSAAPEDDRAIVALGAKCNDAGDAAEAGSARQVAVVYQVEGSGDNSPICQQS